MSCLRNYRSTNFDKTPGVIPTWTAGNFLEWTGTIPIKTPRKVLSAFSSKILRRIFGRISWKTAGLIPGGSSGKQSCSPPCFKKKTPEDLRRKNHQEDFPDGIPGKKFGRIMEEASGRILVGICG